MCKVKERKYMYIWCSVDHLQSMVHMASINDNEKAKVPSKHIRLLDQSKNDKRTWSDIHLA